MKFIEFLTESKDESFQETIKFLNVEVTFEFTKEPKYIIHSKDGIDYINNATDVINKLGLSKKSGISEIEYNTVLFDDKSGFEVINGKLVSVKLDGKVIKVKSKSTIGDIIKT